MRCRDGFPRIHPWRSGIQQTQRRKRIRYKRFEHVGHTVSGFFAGSRSTGGGA